MQLTPTAPAATAATPARRAAPQSARPPELSTAAWVQIGVIAVLFFALFYHNLLRLWQKTAPMIGDPNWAHSVVVPLFGFYYLLIRRDELLATPVRPVLGTTFSRTRLVGGAAAVGLGLVAWLAGGPVFGGTSVGLFDAGAIASTLGKALAGLGLLVLLLDWGLAALLGGFAVSAAGIYLRNDFIWDLGMILTLFGAVLATCGWRVMRIAWFPIAFLICALPWPGIVYSQVAMPLQHLAAQVAVVVLNLTGVGAEVLGTQIVIPMVGGGTENLNVAEACAGMRSLMTFITLAAAVAFVFQYDRPLWQRVLLTVSAVPIAIACNTFRVAGMGILFRYVSPDFANGFAHSFTGLVMLIPAFFLILGVGWVLDSVFIEEADTPATPAAARPAASAAQPAGGAA